MTSPPPRKRSKAPIIFAIIISLLLVGEAALVLMVFSSPTASESLSARLGEAQQSWQGTEDTPGYRERIGTALNDFARQQIATLWAAPKPDPTAPTFAKCITCHPDYPTRVRFNNVYMNHQLHEQEGMECQTCHTMVQHPNPTPPQEKVCAECHDQVNHKDGCDFCHFPGSLPHFYLLGYPRNEAVDCATCPFTQSKPRDLVHAGSFLGDHKAECLSCHEYRGATDYSKPACMDCHAENHPSDWLTTHGLATSVAFQGNSQCTDCHPSATWCAAQCHPYKDPTPKYPMPTEVPSP
jgi:hypothetical protein